MSLYGPRILPSVINVELILSQNAIKTAVRTINNNELEIICSECNQVSNLLNQRQWTKTKNNTTIFLSKLSTS